MASKFEALDLGLIDEGRFMAEVNSDIRKAQKDLVNFVHKHGANAKKAKATVTITISLTCENTEDQAYSVKALTKTSIPNRPASVTMAMANDGDDDEPALFVRASGSSKATPKQGVLTTEDGRPVDLNTGEVKGEPPTR